MMYFVRELGNLPYLVTNGAVYIPSRVAMVTGDVLNFDLWEYYGNYEKFKENVECLTMIP